MSVGLARREANKPFVVFPELSWTGMLLNEDPPKRRRRFQLPSPRSTFEIGLERGPKLACHVASSSRKEEMTTPMHWLSGGSLPLARDSPSSSEEGPVLVFHLSSSVRHICSYSLAGLDEKVANKGSLISRFEANAAIPQLLAQ